MKKNLFLMIILLIISASINASPWRLKAGISNYAPKLKEFSAKNGIYRFTARADIFKLSSRLGLGTMINLSNSYDFYVHNLFGDKSYKGTYLIYGLLMGMRTCKIKASSPEFHGKVTSTFSSFLCGAMLARNDWGTEIMLSQNQQNDWKFDFATKYNFIGKYYLEFGYCHQGPVKEIDKEFSLTFGMELYNQ
jgi:hypothetical protein